MQKTSSYGLIKWTLMLGLGAAMASACVVSSGDADDDDTNIGEGGDSNAGGGDGKAGSPTTNGGAPTTNGGAPTTNGGEPATGGGSGGEGGVAYVPGECQDVDPLEPTIRPSAAVSAEDAADPDKACLNCMKTSCEEEWQTCYGEAPTTACGSGETADPGQMDCILGCFFTNEAGEVDADMLLASCAESCTGACDLLNDETNALVDCANQLSTCQEECFAFE